MQQVAVRVLGFRASGFTYWGGKWGIRGLGSSLSKVQGLRVGKNGNILHGDNHVGIMFPSFLLTTSQFGVLGHPKLQLPTGLY